MGRRYASPDENRCCGHRSTCRSQILASRGFRPMFGRPLRSDFGPPLLRPPGRPLTTRALAPPLYPTQTLRATAPEGPRTSTCARQAPPVQAAATSKISPSTSQGTAAVDHADPGADGGKSSNSRKLFATKHWPLPAHAMACGLMDKCGVNYMLHTRLLVSVLRSIFVCCPGGCAHIEARSHCGWVVKSGCLVDIGRAV